MGVYSRGRTELMRQLVIIVHVGSAIIWDHQARFSFASVILRFDSTRLVLFRLCFPYFADLQLLLSKLVFCVFCVLSDGRDRRARAT